MVMPLPPSGGHARSSAPMPYFEDRAPRPRPLRALGILALVATRLLLHVINSQWAAANDPSGVSILGAALWVAAGVFDITVAIWIAWRLFIWRRIQAAGHSDEGQQASVASFVRSIFASNDFLTTLRTALPAGKDDRDHGFDFIPFMLHALEERRERFRVAAKRFLYLTIGLGLVFSGVLIYFAYMLIHEAAAGTPRTLAELNATASNLRNYQKLAVPVLTESEEFKKLYNEDLLPITKFVPDKPDRGGGQSLETPGAEELKDEILRLGSRADAKAIETLRNELNSVLSRMPRDLDYGVGPAYENAVLKARQSLGDFLIARQRAVENLPASLQAFDDLIKRASESLEKPESHVAEVLKRLFLGVVLATFFIAILRYVGGLYRDNYRQVLVAEHEILNVRRFYVAYKCAADIPETRDKTVAAFMNNFSPDAADGTLADKDGAAENSKVLQELLSLLAKKM